MLRDEVKKAFEILKEGGVILYPTDTIWGIGCDATNAEAVDKVFRLKGRAAEKSLIVLLDTDSKLQGYVKEVPEIAYDLINIADNPLTIIFPEQKISLPNAICRRWKHRNPYCASHQFCIELLKRFRKPIISTSANISGESAPASFLNISQKIIDSVDHIVNWEQNLISSQKPST